MSDDNKLRWCSCKASARDGQHMAWCPAVADAMSDEPNPNPPHIWLAPICEDDTTEGRYWSTEAKDCEDCEEKAVKYIRADLVAVVWPTT